MFLGFNHFPFDISFEFWQYDIKIEVYPDHMH